MIYKLPKGRLHSNTRKDKSGELLGINKKDRGKGHKVRTE